jgi:hypothetical protein
MANLKYKSHHISVQKSGNSVDENEDALWFPENPGNSKSVNLAIADGATESSFSKEWSSLLVSAYKDKSFDKEHLSETLKDISEEWYSIVNKIVLPWYAQHKVETGAFATFLGLTIYKKENKFEIVAIGDCTLFQIRNEKLVFSFPVSSSKDFGNTPNLFASNPSYQLDLETAVIYCNNLIAPKDIILLATDALAAWIFTQIEANEKPWNQLKAVLRNKIFEKWLDEQRKTGKMKNDDVTLLIIEFN